MSALFPASVAAPERALFLDRDGVINVNYGYVHNSANFEFIEGIFNVARKAYTSGYKIIVITNQSGIARGYYSEEQFLHLTSWMCNQFFNSGAPIEKVYFSPFHPTEGLGIYKKDDISRKPRPGMILQAQREMKLDLRNSILIGDKAGDIQAGFLAGVGTNLLFSQTAPPDLVGIPYQLITDLIEALPFFLNSCKRTVQS